MLSQLRRSLLILVKIKEIMTSAKSSTLGLIANQFSESRQPGGVISQS